VILGSNARRCCYICFGCYIIKILELPLSEYQASEAMQQLPSTIDTARKRCAKVTWHYNYQWSKEMPLCLSACQQPTTGRIVPVEYLDVS
jgi:hypothetical protein